MRRAFALTLLFALSPATAGAEGDAQKGREIAVQHCGRCHVVPDYNPMGGIGSTPSFRLLAELDDGLERFETFLIRRPHPASVRMQDTEPPTNLPAALQPFEMTTADLEDLLAYARQLREWQE
jgi:mono/diheme cytochrome c family protein